MFTDIGDLGNNLQGLVTHVLGMRGGEAHTHPRSLCCHQAQQLWECRLIALIAVHILSQQRHLLEAAVTQVTNLTKDALHIPGAFTASGIGHNAVMTEVITASHDAYKTTQLGTMQTLGHHVLIGLGGGQLNIHRFMARLCLSHQVGQGQIGIGASHQIGTVILQQVLLHALGHTAQHANNQRALTFDSA